MQKKTLILNNKNKYKYIYKHIAIEKNIYFFISQQIVFLKKFKKNVINNLEFIN